MDIGVAIERKGRAGLMQKSLVETEESVAELLTRRTYPELKERPDWLTKQSERFVRMCLDKARFAETKRKLEVSDWNTVAEALTARVWGMCAAAAPEDELTTLRLVLSLEGVDLDAAQLRAFDDRLRPLRDSAPRLKLQCDCGCTLEKLGPGVGSVTGRFGLLRMPFVEIVGRFPPPRPAPGPRISLNPVDEAWLCLNAKEAFWLHWFVDARVVFVCKRCIRGSARRTSYVFRIDTLTKACLEVWEGHQTSVSISDAWISS